jgi:hypothetical protein
VSGRRRVALPVFRPSVTVGTWNQQRLLSLRDQHRGILLFYPVREKATEGVSIGFELLFPKNNISFDMNFTVRRKTESARIVVNDPASD